MNSYLITTKTKNAIPIVALTASDYKLWAKKQTKEIAAWLAESNFKADASTFVRIPSITGGAECILTGIDKKPTLWSLAHLPAALAKGKYYLHGNHSPALLHQLAIGWQLACYQYDSFRKNTKTYASLYMPAAADPERAKHIAEALCMGRDLINTPTNAMLPSDLAEAAKAVADRFKASVTVITGNDLLKKNYPMIHAVGRASENAPRLIDMRWGNTKHPKVTLVGKGVCFDSGGLDIKTAGGMKLMKKDMGGAAAVLSLSTLIMQYALPVRLRVLIPAVENSISSNSFRPMDIYKTRNGKTVEIGNTDAEGRLILCDALSEADSEKPDLIIDCATLTGAARTALGTDIPALFSNNDKLAAKLQAISFAQNDPLWQLPLWPGYREYLNSPIADMNNAPDSPYAGAVTAALFLHEFVSRQTNWIHIDMMAWNVQNRPGRPAGGEAMAVRSLFTFLEQQYCK